MVGPGLWGVDPSTVVTLRLDSARKALLSGDADGALVEAEELLDRYPDQAEALRVVIDAALVLGDATLAESACTSLLSQRPEDGELLALLGISWFGLGRFSESADAALRALQVAPGLAVAWHARALSTERLGDQVAAAMAYTEAARLEPARFPAPELVPEGRWSAALDMALTGLPDDLHLFFAATSLRWAEFPSADDLSQTDPPLSPLSDCLYVGDPSAEDAPEVPSAVVLYRGNLGRPDSAPAALAERIQRALVHEARAWTAQRLGESAVEIIELG